MSKEYIEREMILRHKRKMSGSDFDGEFWDEAVLCEDIFKIPAADVVEVRHGKWIEGKRIGLNVLQYTCSECGLWADTKFPYCHCGAKMDGKGDK